MYCNNIENDIYSIYPYDGENIQEILCKLTSEIQRLKDTGKVFDAELYKPLIAKLKNVVTLEQLGAVGDGVTDDIDAFDKAKELLNAGVVKKVIGYGTYGVSRHILLSPKNEIEYDLGFIKALDSFPDYSYIVKAGDDNGSQSGLQFKAIGIDGNKKPVIGINITSTGGSIFDVGTIMNCYDAGIKIDNPTQISSDNLLKGNVIRQCGYGIVLRSENTSACEGTMIKYNFIYDNKYAGILLGKGSHYSDIHSMTDFNGKYNALLTIEGNNCWRRGDYVSVGKRQLIVVESFEDKILIQGSENLSNQDFTGSVVTCSAGTSNRILKTEVNKPDLNEYIDIVNANTKAGFSKNTIIASYTGGIYGSRLSICTDFIVFAKTGTNERNNIGGISTRMNPLTVDILDSYEGKMIMNYNHDPNNKPQHGININGNKIFSRIVGYGGVTNTQVPISNFNSDNLNSGTYLVSITPTVMNSEFAYCGILFWDKEKNLSTLHTLKEHNIQADTDSHNLLRCNLGQAITLTVYTTFLKIG